MTGAEIEQAMNLLDKSMTDETKTVVEYSSGSTVISMSLMARIFHGTDDTRAFLSNKTSGTKLKLMQFFGLDLFVACSFLLFWQSVSAHCV